MKSDLDFLLMEEMPNPKFSKAWEKTESEDQIKRVMIEARILKEPHKEAIHDRK